MYAVIATGGKQLKVQEQDVVSVERIEGEVGSKIALNENQVLALGEGSELKVGTPFVAGAKVEAEIVEQFRGPKLIAFKMKRRKGSRVRKGHRQELTKIKILSIA